MTSFDIVSLYTNIPLVEILSINTNRVYQNHYRTFDGRPLNCSKDVLIIVSEIKFLFSVKFCTSKWYESPVLANICLDSHENIWPQNCLSEIETNFFKRYINDTFILFISRIYVWPFLDYLNSQHHSIWFIHETETNGQYSFLDVRINKKGDMFWTDLFRQFFWKCSVQ